jgi:hypothetical protein
MTGESVLWRLLKKAMRQAGHEAIRIENVVGLGNPDVIYCLDKKIMGWIELKYLSHWPKRKTTIIKLRHFTKEQRLFFKKAKRWSNRVHMLLRIEKDLMLLTAPEALNYIGTLTKTELLSKIDLEGRHWKVGKIDWEEFFNLLKN